MGLQLQNCTTTTLSIGWVCGSRTGQVLSMHTRTSQRHESTWDVTVIEINPWTLNWIHERPSALLSNVNNRKETSFVRRTGTEELDIPLRQLATAFSYISVTFPTATGSIWLFRTASRFHATANDQHTSVCIYRYSIRRSSSDHMWYIQSQEWQKHHNYNQWIFVRKSRSRTL